MLEFLVFGFSLVIRFLLIYSFVFLVNYRGGSDNKATAHHVSFSKPRHSDSISVKEKFIQAKV